MTEPPQFPPPPEDDDGRPQPQQLPSYPMPAYPPGWQPPPKQRNGRKVALGIVIGIAAPFVFGFLTTVIGSATGNGVGPLGGLVPLLLLLGPIGLIVPDRTRFIGVGIYIGYAALLVLGAGLCVVLLATWNGGG